MYCVAIAAPVRQTWLLRPVYCLKMSAFTFTICGVIAVLVLLAFNTMLARYCAPLAAQREAQVSRRCCSCVLAPVFFLLRCVLSCLRQPHWQDHKLFKRNRSHYFTHCDSMALVLTVRFCGAESKCSTTTASTHTSSLAGSCLYH